MIVLFTGVLHRDPEPKTSKGGKEYAQALIRSGDGLSVQGKAEISTYLAKDGATKVSVSVMANQIVVLRQPKKERTP
jgi:hypothetical protein